MEIVRRENAGAENSWHEMQGLK